jgi:protein-S-isoprenylcysteine O-methyltransferase Ste14
LIQTGPYRFVRHPIYSGILLLALGTAIVFGRVIFLIDAGIILGLLFWKSRIEDRFLAAHFGEAFENYRRRVAALIPWLF